MDKQSILEAITHIETLEDVSSWDLQTILADYPFFQTAHLLWARKSMDSGNYDQTEILQKAAIYAGSRSVLYKLLHQRNTGIRPDSVLEDPTLQLDRDSIPLIFARRGNGW